MTYRKILTRRLNESNAFLNEDWDLPVRSDHCRKQHAEVVAFRWFRAGMPGFGSHLFLTREEENSII